MSTPMPPSSPPPVAPIAATGRPAASPPPPRSLEAGSGISWISEGWQIFTASPGTWIAIVVILFVILFVIGVVPLIGHVVTTVLTPVFGAGLMLGCHALARGQPLTVSHLFDGFRSPAMGSLMVIGLIGLGIMIALALACFAIMVGSVGFDFLQQMMRGGENFEFGAGFIMRVGVAGLFVALLAVIVVSVWMMLAWFAPALVVIDGVAPWEAMKASFRACLVNIGPFLLYGLVLLVLAIVATIPLMLGWLVLAPVTVGSQYAGWRTIFSRA